MFTLKFLINIISVFTGSWFTLKTFTYKAKIIFIKRYNSDKPSRAPSASGRRSATSFSVCYIFGALTNNMLGILRLQALITWRQHSTLKSEKNIENSDDVSGALLW